MILMIGGLLEWNIQLVIRNTILIKQIHTFIILLNFSKKIPLFKKKHVTIIHDIYNMHRLIVSLNIWSKSNAWIIPERNGIIPT